jgi:hypothetical protein
MRLPEPDRTLLRVAISLNVALATLACQNASSVTGPGGGVSPAVSIAGSWSGTFQPDDSATCGNSSASATFQQEGTMVTGNVKTSDCGVSGYFNGTLQGNTLIGSVKMEGCVGGQASGTVSGSQLSLAIGDLTKPLVTGEKPVMTGGVVALRR